MLTIPQKRLDEEKDLEMLDCEGYLDYEMKLHYNNVKTRNDALRYYVPKSRAELKRRIKIFAYSSNDSLSERMEDDYYKQAYKEVYRQMYPGFKNRLYRIF